MIPSLRTKETGTCVGCLTWKGIIKSLPIRKQNNYKLTHSHSPLNCEISGTTHNMLSWHLYIVSASTSPNHTCKDGEKLSPVNSSIATSPPPFRWRLWTIGTGVTGDLKGKERNIHIFKVFMQTMWNREWFKGGNNCQYILKPLFSTNFTQQLSSQGNASKQPPKIVTASL